MEHVNGWRFTTQSKINSGDISVDASIGRKSFEPSNGCESHYSVKERIYLILDNFSPHHRPEIHRWAKENKVTLVWTPTNASWMNHIESQFTEPKDFVLSDSNYKSHFEMQHAWNNFIRYRNKRNSKHKIT